MNKKVFYYILVAVIAAGVGFFGGMSYGQSSSQNNLSQQGAGGFGARQRGGAPGTTGANRGGLINGQIVNKDDKSVTIKLRTGGSQFVFFSPSTQILKSDSGTADDLKAGDNIMVSGTANSDGSVSAQMIQIRPAGMDFPGFTGGSTQQFSLSQQTPPKG